MALSLGLTASTRAMAASRTSAGVTYRVAINSARPVASCSTYFLEHFDSPCYRDDKASRLCFEQLRLLRTERTIGKITEADADQTVARHYRQPHAFAQR